MRARRAWVSGIVMAALAAVAGGGAPGVATADGANPWLARRVLNIAHQGGHDEAPSNTLYALKSAVPKGSDVLEVDVHATKDGELVVIHDATVNRTTNGTGRVDQLTLAEIQALDAAYWFVPGKGTTREFATSDPSRYTLRGVRDPNGPPPPAGYERDDFAIPTLRRVLELFPHMFINIEIKATAPDTAPYEETLADLLAEFGRTQNTIVVSFLDHAIEKFKIHAPDVHTATATAETALFKISSGFGPTAELRPVTTAPPGAPNPRYVALQVPITFNGIEVVTKDFVDDAHANGLAVHVWTIDDAATMAMLVELGVDGIMTNYPTVLEAVLQAKGVAI